MANGSSVQASSGQPASVQESKAREYLSLVVVVVALLGIFILAWQILSLDVTKQPTQVDLSKYVFGAILPLLATWVGTILAFYFSKENFNAATQSVADMAKSLSGIERLRTIGVKEKMRQLPDIKSMVVPPAADATTKLSDLLTKFSVERIPLLDSNNAVRLLIYRAQITGYLGEQALSGILPPALAALTLKDLLSDPKRLTLYTTSFAFVAETATLADAKLAMDQITGCNDVFVTHSGGRSEALVGWITDNTIIENSRV